MNIAVGIAEGRSSFQITLDGAFISDSGERFEPGLHELAKPIRLRPVNADTAIFIVEDVAIGIGFHWQRTGRQGFRGGLRILRDRRDLTLVNDVELDTYVESVICSEMSQKSPIELLKTHAVISRSWLLSQIRGTGAAYRLERQTGPAEWEILCWYGRESHELFDVCADDHCQRYQGVPGPGSGEAGRAVRDTASEFLVWNGNLCDARFSKCCGGVTEDYRSAWDDAGVPYLRPVSDGPGGMPEVTEDWIRSSPPAYCNTRDSALLSRILPGFDQETVDFFRWEVRYAPGELSELVKKHTGIDLGDSLRLTPVARGASGRIVKLRIEGSAGILNVGKELEIRRILSPSHLYSSAFVVTHGADRVRLSGAGWGHGVGMCQIGAGVMAVRGMQYRAILSHYYPGTSVEKRPADWTGD